MKNGGESFTYTDKTEAVLIRLGKLDITASPAVLMKYSQEVIAEFSWSSYCTEESTKLGKT